MGLRFRFMLGSLIALTGQELVFEWLAFTRLSLKFRFLIVFDWISLFFMSTVCLISARVLFYSRSYIRSDLYYSRFILLVLSFVSSIWILILSPNFIRILLGWDGLGVTSYLLVIYFQREKSFNAGILTALTNRLGDACLLCLIGFSSCAGRWGFIYLSSLEFYRSLVLGFALGAAITKSAQVPFSAWLPAAMAAPTPVSSLVHSSTLVTAGVYLLIRLNYLIASVNLLTFILLTGITTMLLAGASAMGEVDIKKIIALSTLSQLGLMFMVLGIGLPILAFFHLVAHAYFKAMLFMCAGGVIHSLKEYQDLRKIGNRGTSLPLSVGVFSVANLSLCGMPFIAGFYSKDLVLELIMINPSSLVAIFIVILATGLTAIYSIRAIKLVFFSTPMEEAGALLQESDKIMLLGILILLLPSIGGGLLISWITMSRGYLIFLPLWIKLLILRFVGLARFWAAVFSLNFKKRAWWQFVHHMWFLPLLFPPQARKVGLGTSKEFLLSSEAGWSLHLILKVGLKLRALSSGVFSQILQVNFLKSAGLLIFRLFFLV